MEQLQLFRTRPDDGFRCDQCHYLVWHRNGDGYCCCLAPEMDGRGFEGAKNRKGWDFECSYFEDISVPAPWTIAGQRYRRKEVIPCHTVL